MQIRQEIHTIQREVQLHVLLETVMVQELQHVRLERPDNLQDQCDQTQEQQDQQREAQGQQPEVHDQAQEQHAQLIADQHQGQVVL